MVFCNFLEIKAETKKVVGVKVVPFRVLYSCVKFRRLKMGDPVYFPNGCVPFPTIASNLLAFSSKMADVAARVLPKLLYFYFSDYYKPGSYIDSKTQKCQKTRVINLYISAYISKVYGHLWLKLGSVPSKYKALMLFTLCRN